jgi:hypothetical protein
VAGRGSGGTTSTGSVDRVATASAVEPAGRRPAGLPRTPSTATASSAPPRQPRSRRRDAGGQSQLDAGPAGQQPRGIVAVLMDVQANH